jgi:acetyltransferase
VDLAVIAIPAASVPEAIRECAQKGVSGAIIISAGFKEIGPKGAELECQILAEVRSQCQSGPRNMRIIGPNCSGRNGSLERVERHFRHHHGPTSAMIRARTAL